MYICKDHKICKALTCMHKKPHGKSKWCKIEKFSICRGCVEVKECSEKRGEVEYNGKHYRIINREK